MPPKAKRSKSPDSRFLFVNEDASTVTRTSKDSTLDRTKQSHVQRQNFARRRRLREQNDLSGERTGQGSVSPDPVVAGSSTQAGATSSPGYFDNFQSFDQSESTLFQSTGPPSLDPRFAGAFPEDFAITPTSPPLHGTFDSSYGLPQTYLSSSFDISPPIPSTAPTTRSPASTTSPSNPTNIFSSRPSSRHHALEHWAPALIRYYNTVILSERFWKDSQKVSLSRLRHAPSIHLDMQACMAEPPHLYALLASAAAQAALRGDQLHLLNVSRDDIQRASAYFKAKAIQALRSKLVQGQLDFHTVVDSHRLYAAAIRSQGPEAAEPHLQALFAMIDALGGLATFGDYSLEMIFSLDCTVAMERLDIPRLPMVLDPGDLPEELQSATCSESLRSPGSMLEYQLSCLQACQPLSESFVDLVQVIKVSSYLHNSLLYIHDYYRWFSWETLVILHRLLTMPLHHDLNDMADSARIAAIFWTALVRSPAAGRLTASQAVPMLHARLQTTDLVTFWGTQPKLLLWIAVIGGICCMDDDDLDWFLQLAQATAVDVGVENVHQLENLLTAFLYDPPSQRGFVLEFAVRMWSHR